MLSVLKEGVSLRMLAQMAIRPASFWNVLFLVVFQKSWPDIFVNLDWSQSMSIGTMECELDNHTMDLYFFEFLVRTHTHIESSSK
jgi:hypothetical protein